MKIEAGKYYITRDGRKAEVIGINQEAIMFHKCIGWVSGTNYQWSIEGAFNSDESGNDLIAEWQDEPPELKEIDLLIEQEVVSQRIYKLNQLIAAVNQLIRERKGE